MKELEQQELKEKQARAFDLEMAGANRSYAAGFGVCEWESFLTASERDELNKLAELGCGTLGKERLNKTPGQLRAEWAKANKVADSRPEKGSRHG